MAGDDWRRCTVGDITAPMRNALVGGPFGSNLITSDYVRHGVPVVRGQNLGRGRWVDGEFAFVTSEKANSLSANLARAGDLVFTQRGTLGQVALVPENRFDRYLISQSQMKLTVDPGKVDATFLYYVFQSREQQDHIRRNTIQTGVPHTNLGILRDTPLLLPPLIQQRSIAHILGTLDDKIELHRRMNETLEAMARALFKSWFVDFDPVRAKAEGRDTGLPKHIADLFSDRFQESESGAIPDGWVVGSLLKQAQLLSGGTPKTDRPEYWDGRIRWVSAKDVSQSDQSLLISTERTITELGLKESATQIIPAFSTVVVARGATTGRMAMLGSDMAMNQTCYALHSSSGCNFALYCQIRQVMDELVHRAHGSIFNTITTNTFQTSRFVLAPGNILREFEIRVEPMFRQILAKSKQSRTLACIRDALLPKLLSGEIRVKAAEKFLGASL